MRPSTEHLEHYRDKKGPFKSDKTYGMNGLFIIPDQHKRCKLVCIASDQMLWDHVSVSVRNEQRTPTWAEMCYIKDLFWDVDELVIQYHPAEKDYINTHSFVLHLWKPIGVELPKPPKIFV